jgi:hypothetical protein
MMGRYTVLFLALGLVLWAYHTQRQRGAAPELPQLPEHPLVRAKLEAELLLTEGMGIAQLMLARRGEFPPFASGLTEAGDIVHLSEVPGTADKRSREVVEILESLLRESAEREGYKATAVVSDVRLELEGDAAPRPAVQVSLEHREGYCVDVIVPYRGSGEEIEFEPMLARPRTGRVYSTCRELPLPGELTVDRGSL